MSNFDGDDASEGWSTWVEPYQGTPEYSYRYAVWKAGFLFDLTAGQPNADGFRTFRPPSKALVVSRLKIRTSVKHKRCRRVLFEVVDLPFRDEETGMSAARPALRAPASGRDLGEYFGPQLFGLSLDLRARDYWLPCCLLCTADLDVDPEMMFDDERTSLDLPPVAELLHARRTVMLAAKMRER